ncbi:hypothetical protein AAFF_G00278030 [Aldrovandia affinis]|uniref:Uncharacterized protein n=1 Tax=Aldrovandia affinis TaxID=143900 RepID=A0AAD7SQU9_9TELE|nr:hypothetical protein AAFF_G00278030 [Aldrovandia affinis]
MRQVEAEGQGSVTRGDLFRTTADFYRHHHQQLWLWDAVSRGDLEGWGLGGVVGAVRLVISAGDTSMHLSGLEKGLSAAFRASGLQLWAKATTVHLPAGGPLQGTGGWPVGDDTLA